MILGLGWGSRLPVRPLSAGKSRWIRLEPRGFLVVLGSPHWTLVLGTSGLTSDLDFLESWLLVATIGNMEVSRRPRGLSTRKRRRILEVEGRNFLSKELGGPTR